MAKNTIKIKKYSDIIEEYVAAAAITPGNFLEMDSAGKVKKHATAGGHLIPMVALENELEGQGITDAYATADQVQVWITGRGDQVYALLANGETAVIGSALISDGAGALKVATADSSGVVVEEHVVAYALEAVDMADSSGADPTGRIEVVIA